MSPRLAIWEQRKLIAPYRVVFNGKFFGASPTGVHRVAEELLHAIDALLAGDPKLSRRYDIEVLLPPDVPRYPLLKNIRVRTCGRFRRRLWEQYDLPRHANGALVLSLCNLGPVLARFAVTMIHDAQVHITPESYSPAFRAWYRLVQPIVGRRHRAVLTVSRFSREQLALYGVAPKARVHVIHNGTDHMDRIVASRSAITRHRLRAGSYVMALSTVQAHKNINLLFEAFAGVPSETMVLALYGDSTRADFEARGIVVPECVRFLGRIEDEDLKALLGGALCLAFPSLTEGFGLPPLEAMRVGCPVVVAPRGALPEVCGEAALYADPADPGAWRRAFESLRADPALRARCVTAGVANADRFTWERAGRATLHALEAIDHV